MSDENIVAEEVQEVKPKKFKPFKPSKETVQFTQTTTVDGIVRMKGAIMQMDSSQVDELSNLIKII